MSLVVNQGSICKTANWFSSYQLRFFNHVMFYLNYLFHYDLSLKIPISGDDNFIIIIIIIIISLIAIPEVHNSLAIF